MTDVLWLLYAAQVGHGLQVVFGAILFLTVLGEVVWTFYNIVDEDRFPPHILKIASAAVLLAVFASLIPGERLLLTAAGMRAGVEVAESDIGKKSLLLLDKALSEAIKKMENEK
jgi:hypothetical protein